MPSHPQSNPSLSDTEATAVQALLAEYAAVKRRYTRDPFVQAMAMQLSRLAGLSTEAAIQTAVPESFVDGELEQGPVDVVTAMSGYLSRCSSGGMPQAQVHAVAAAVAEAQDLGYFALLRTPASMADSDVERLLYVGRVLRAIADEGAHAPVGDLWGEVVCASGVIKRVLNIADVDVPKLGLIEASILPPGSPPARYLMLEGWKDAAIAWTVCASIHRAFAKGKDAMFTTRQADFERHADDAQARFMRFRQAPAANDR